MLNQVTEAIRRSSRLMVLRHPNAVDVLVYRKKFLRDENDGNGIQTLGGMMMLSSEDESEYEMTRLGAGKMQFLGRVLGSDWAVTGLDYGENDVTAYIEPIDDGAFTVRNDDRVVWIMPNFVKHFQVIQTHSPVQMPVSRLNVYHLQPLEQPYTEESE